MFIAHIAPTDALRASMFKNQAIHMAIANQVLGDVTYATFYRFAPGWVMLDTPVAENKSPEPYSLGQLTQAVRRIHPHAVVLPDIFKGSVQDNVRSQRAAAGYLEPLRNEMARGGLEFIAVPWGATLEEYIECAHELNAIPGVTTLGIGELTAETIHTPRAKIIKTLAGLFPKKRLHLLGCLDDLSDIMDPLARLLAFSMDTCHFVRYGIQRLEPTAGHIPPYPGRGPGYFERTVSTLDLEYIGRNIKYWNMFCANRGGNHEVSKLS
jgi:hypothetical protein